jgi:predicted esterase
MTPLALGMLLAIWVEGENYKTAPEGLPMTVAPKAPASGGKVLYGSCLAAKGSVVTYEIDLPADIKDARIIFRYARLHTSGDMKPAAVEVALDAGAGPGAEVKREAAFADTKGWGVEARHFRLLPVEVGDLKKGRHSLKLTSLAEDNDVNLDGFFVAAKDFKITDEELDRCCRIQITSDGYVGLPWRTVVFRQDREPRLYLAVRAFDGSPAQGGTVTMRSSPASLTSPAAPTSPASPRSRASSTSLTAPASAPGQSGPAETLAAAEGAPPTQGLQAFTCGKRGDGAYTLAAEYKKPACTLAAAVMFGGDYLAEFDARLKAVAEAAGEGEKRADPLWARAKPDFQHVVEYLAVNSRRLGGGQLLDLAALAGGLDALEGVPDPNAVQGDLRRVLGQAEGMVKNLQAGRPAHDGLTGDLRRAFRSAADGKLIPYRALVPDAYAKAEAASQGSAVAASRGSAVATSRGSAAAATSRGPAPGGTVPLVCLLHGSGGDENAFAGMADGKVLEILSRRGYLAVMPRWQGRPIADVLQLVELTLADYPRIDRDRVYCTGFSMGGFGSYRLATEHPDLLAAIACAAGTGDPGRAERLKNVPALILQGGADPIVPPDEAAKVAARLKELGYAVDFRLFPKYAHDYPPEEYINLTLDFLDQHTRKK